VAAGLSALPPKAKQHWYAFNSFTLQAILLVVIGLICFGNTFTMSMYWMMKSLPKNQFVCSKAQKAYRR
jgi:hypothetical protein